jgi:uncharacterized membrane protein
MKVEARPGWRTLGIDGIMRSRDTRKDPPVELDSQTGALFRKRHVRRALALLCLLLVTGYVLVPPLAPLDKAHLVGYTICHQIPGRSFHMGGFRLPLCARCTGTYLGVAITFVALGLFGRLRSGEMPSKRMLVVLAIFILTMGLDGLNSYLSLFEGAPTLYAPRNWLRAATGSLNGIALSLIVLPVFNYTLWKRPLSTRPLRHAWELAAILAFTSAAIVTVQSEPSWLLYPIAMVSVGGVLGMLTLVNTMILLIVFRQENQAVTWREAVVPLLSGLTVTLLELTLMGVLRYTLTGTMGWPIAL